MLQVTKVIISYYIVDTFYVNKADLFLSFFSHIIHNYQIQKGHIFVKTFPHLIRLFCINRILGKLLTSYFTIA